MAQKQTFFTFHINNRELPFVPAALTFNKGYEQNVFALKNNKTVRETLADPKYSKFTQKVMRNYASSLDTPLGEFLLQLKTSENPFYKEFLNPNGDGKYVVFTIADPCYIHAKGLYTFLLDGQVKYIGRCLDSFGKRINQGYGRIHPKNCYIDGQSTNCRLNALISRYRDRVSFFVFPLTDDKEIEYLENVLIKKHQPEWNVAG